MTLQDIVSKCLGNQRSNTNTAGWKAGLCSNVGTMTSQQSVTNVNPVLRIGVGDGSADGADWALIMPVKGNGNGDYLGANIWNFGGENETNNGYTGKVTITGKACAPLSCTSTVLFEVSNGNNGTYRNTWAGWYATGTTVSSGNGKRAAYDTLKIDALRLSDASGRFVEYDLGPGYKGRTLQDIVAKCMGSQRSNTNQGNWKAGLCSQRSNTNQGNWKAG